MGENNILDIIDELRNCGVEEVQIGDLTAEVKMTIRGFVVMFAKQKEKWNIENNETYKTVNVDYNANGVTYRMYVGSYGKMEEIAKYVGLKYEKPQTALNY